MKNLLEKVKDRNLKITILGMGYIGLPTAILSNPMKGSQQRLRILLLLLQEQVLWLMGLMLIWKL